MCFSSVISLGVCTCISGCESGEVARASMQMRECVLKEAVTQKHIRERWKAREGWVTTLLVPPLAIQFCPNNSRLMHQAETFHISSLRSFWQLTSCSMLFFAMMAWVSHSAFSVTLPTAMLPAVQCSKSVPQPKVSHLVHFPLTLHNSNFKSHQYRVSWGKLDGGGDWGLTNTGRGTSMFLYQDELMKIYQCPYIANICIFNHFQNLKGVPLSGRNMGT